MFNFKGILPETEMNGHYKFMISIEGFYDTFHFYYNDRIRELFGEMLSKLRINLSDIIVNHSGSRMPAPVKYVSGVRGSGGCDEIYESDSYGEQHRLVYLHPQEFTGYLDEEDINRLCDFVNDFIDQNRKVLGKNAIAKIHYMKPTSTLSDHDYRDLLAEYSPEIIARVKEQMTEDVKEGLIQGYCLAINDIGFDFARTGRLEREFDKQALCGGDVDVETVCNIITIAKNNGVFADIGIPGKVLGEERNL